MPDTPETRSLLSNTGEIRLFGPRSLMFDLPGQCGRLAGVSAARLGPYSHCWEWPWRGYHRKTCRFPPAPWQSQAPPEDGKRTPLHPWENRGPKGPDGESSAGGAHDDREFPRAYAHPWYRVRSPTTLGSSKGDLARSVLSCLLMVGPAVRGPTNKRPGLACRRTAWSGQCEGERSDENA